MKTNNARKILAICLTIALALLLPFTCLAATVGVGKYTDSRAAGTKLWEAVNASPSDAVKKAADKGEAYTVTGENLSVKYDGSKHSIDFKLVDENGKIVTDGVTWSYETSPTGTGNWTSAGSNNPAVQDVEKMYVKAKAVKNAVEIVSEVYSMEATKREVTITSASAEKKYDGTALTRTDPACDVTVSGDGFVAGETYGITFNNSSVTYTGSVENKFDCMFYGTAKSGNYIIEKVFGTLTVIPTDAYIITADSASKEYDGTALTAEGYTESGELCGADTLVSARTVGTITEVGTAENKIEATITNGSGEDVTNCYTLVSGTLTIYPNAADAVKKAISQIGTVTYTQACKAKIDAARAAYEALTEAQKADVTNYSTLTAAEAAYGKLLQKVDAAILKIDEIGTVKYTSACKAKIDAARAAYEALTKEQKEAVTNYRTLTAAEAAYGALLQKVDAAILKINEIGTVEYTSACKAKIDAARAAYEALTETQKADVTNYAVLTAAEAKYERLERNNKSSGNSGGEVYSAPQTTGTGTGTWSQPATGTWTKDANGNWVFGNKGHARFTGTWGYIQHAGSTAADWYRFGADGKMLTGFQVIDGKTYYFREIKDNREGAMETGFQTINGKIYYFDEKRNSEGGAMATGWKTIGGKDYYFGTDGVLLTGGTTPDRKQVGADGAVIA